MIEVFAHRGFTNNKKLGENSPESLQKAYELGFRAVEFDVWLIEGKLVLKHDAPKIGEILPQFSDYFCFGNQMRYWIDFKNLTAANCVEFLRLMKADIDKFDIDLAQVFFAPFITDYLLAEKIYAEIRKVFGDKANVIAVCDNLENDVEAKNLARFLTENQVKFLSIYHKLLDENLLEILRGIKIFAWTVNDAARLRELEKLGVVAVATDVIVNA